MISNFTRAITLTILVAFNTGCADKVEPDPIPEHDTFTLQSKELNEKRVITVWTPPEYTDSSASLPVLYMLDGGVKEDFPHIANTIASLVSKSEIAPVILVGIENTERRRDLTGPSNVEADAEIAPLSDGATQFRQFIKTELFPEVGKRYRVTKQRAIVGESVAGLFIVETLLLEPTMFNTYLAIDPSLWWNDQYLVKEAANLIQNLPQQKLKFWFAGSDAEDISPHTKKLASLLKAQSPENLQWIYLPQPKQRHNTIFRATKEAAFKWGLWGK